MGCLTGGGDRNALRISLLKLVSFSYLKLVVVVNNFVCSRANLSYSLPSISFCITILLPLLFFVHQLICGCRVINISLRVLFTSVSLWLPFNVVSSSACKCCSWPCDLSAKLLILSTLSVAKTWVKVQHLHVPNELQNSNWIFPPMVVLVPPQLLSEELKWINFP